MAIAYAIAGAAIIGISARSALDKVSQEIKQAASAAGKPEPKVATVAMDVTSEESVRDAMSQVSKEFNGRLDILINNAGYLESRRSLGDVDVSEWWKSWEVNIKGQVHVWQAMLPLLLADEQGLKTMVNISSIGAQMIAPGASAYQTNKFALLRLTEFLDVEYAEQGLLAFCMHPGAVPTELASALPDQSILIDTPELMADTVVFLTQKRREWLRGRYISTTWDMQEFLAMEDDIVKGDKLKMRMVV